LLINTFDICVLEDISASNGIKQHGQDVILNPLNAELNPIYHLLALLGVHHIFHVSGLRVNEDRIHRKVLPVKLKE